MDDNKAEAFITKIGLPIYLVSFLAYVAYSLWV
jgi:hypothetical protein